MDALRARFKAEMKGAPQSEWNTPENSARWQKMYQAMRDSPEYKKQMGEYERLENELLRYVKRSEKGRGLARDPAVSHGYVWLFRQK